MQKFATARGPRGQSHETVKFRADLPAAKPFIKQTMIGQKTYGLRWSWTGADDA
jgi:hypothetical protein